MFRRVGVFVTSIVAPVLNGCSTVVPHFDIPYDERGAPTAHSIANRVTCELAAIIEESDSLRQVLLLSDVAASVQLSLTVNDTGSLAPSFTYTWGMFSFNAGASLSQSREQNFVSILHYSMRSLAKEMEAAKSQNRDLGVCTFGETNLAGNLGLKETTELALSIPHLDWTTKLSGTSGVFGGYVNFLVTKNLNSVGPTWMLKHFKGPGSLAGISEVNTDKLTFAFARGPNVGKPYNLESALEAADQLIDSINLNQVSTELGSIKAGLQ